MQNRGEGERRSTEDDCHYYQGPDSKSRYWMRLMPTVDENNIGAISLLLHMNSKLTLLAKWSATYYHESKSQKDNLNERGHPACFVPPDETSFCSHHEVIRWTSLHRDELSSIRSYLRIDRNVGPINPNQSIRPELHCCACENCGHPCVDA